MRKIPALVVTLGLVASLSACATSAAPGSAGCPPTGDAASVVTATGAFGEKPEATVPSPIVTTETQVSTVIEGDGARLVDGSPVLIDYTLFDGSTGTEVENSGYDGSIGNPVTVGGSALYSEVRPGDWRREYSDVTKTQSFEVHAGMAPLQSQSQTLTLTAGFQFTNISESDIFGTLYNDHLRIASLTADYMLKDDFGGTSYLTGTLRQGIDVLGASRAGDDYLSRYDGSGTFTTVNLWFARYQSLTDDWSLKIAGAGQYASTELLTSQQYYLGGAFFGRGYGSAEISGDNAMAGSLELRYDGKPSLPYTRGYQFYGFVDTGAVWNVGYGYRDGLSLTSAGGGVRLFFDGDLRADVGIGVPLSYRSPNNDNRSPVLLFSLSNAFRLCPERARFGCT